MVKKYDHIKIEKKWQKKWIEQDLYKTKNNASDKKKFYILDMFPYPSGEGLHVGHPKGYIATDVISRMKRMQGFNVLHPMGFDAFGLPAENYAIKMKTNPEISTKKNVARFKKQLGILGLDYDWTREINTTDPKYYKWTQWIFLQMFNKGLAYESYEPINWCPSCKTGLANEDLDGDKCERCGTKIEKKPMRQWVLRITDYAERLLNDIDKKDRNGKFLIEWPESIKELQRNWIGKSEGSEIEFKIKDTKEKIKVFTTRADTIFGATYVVVAPEHKLITNCKLLITNFKEVEKYINEVKDKTEIERVSDKEKTGVELKGIKAINPANGEEIPIWISDYVLMDYGTGAVMAVPAHDERDFEFAKKYNLSIREVISGENISEKAFTDYGVLTNSEKFNGMSSEQARIEITKFVGGKVVVKYKLRDWVFSRQRYWGEPIPLVHCEKCGVVAVPEKDLPVKLPKVKYYEPTGTGESPLAAISSWVNVKCPNCRGKAKRETNTMPQWAGSSWYYLRYMDPNNSKKLVDIKNEKYWSPVDHYVGGAEHATRHLIYARFWHKFLKDIEVVSTDEPFKKLQHVGLIMGEDGRKMSKRWGNVVNPDDVVKTFGADTMRLYEMFMGPFDQAVAWNTNSMMGARRFIERIWKMYLSVISNKNKPENVDNLIHKAIKKITEDIEDMKYNTAISMLMITLNELEKMKNISKSDFKKFLQILAPFAPHITEELWYTMGEKKSIHISSWPKWDKEKVIDSLIKIAIQVNGKVRSEIEVSKDIEEADLKKLILDDKNINNWTSGKEIKRFIYVKGRIVNIVI